MFQDNNTNAKWEKLVEFYSSLEIENFSLIQKKLCKKLKPNEIKDLFVILLGNYLDNNFAKWDGIKKKIQNINENIIDEPGFFAKLFGGESESEEVKAVEKDGKPAKQRKQESKKDDGKGKDNDNYIEMHINIGKDKKVYPQHLIRFICESMKIDKEQIKNIRIFDKYSFFKIPKNLGDKAVILLSVKKFRGKKISVNYSKRN